jgi:hypothetical protein
MGGTQAMLSLTLILGPTLAGLSFQFISVPAPYWLGSLLAGMALLLAQSALRESPPAPVSIKPAGE